MGHQLHMQDKIEMNWSSIYSEKKRDSKALSRLLITFHHLTYVEHVVRKLSPVHRAYSSTTDS